MDLSKNDIITTVYRKIIMATYFFPNSLDIDGGGGYKGNSVDITLWSCDINFHVDVLSLRNINNTY